MVDIAHARIRYLIKRRFLQSPICMSSFPACVMLCRLAPSVNKQVLRPVLRVGVGLGGVQGRVVIAGYISVCWGRRLLLQL